MNRLRVPMSLSLQRDTCRSIPSELLQKSELNQFFIRMRYKVEVDRRLNFMYSQFRSCVQRPTHLDSNWLLSALYCLNVLDNVGYFFGSSCVLVLHLKGQVGVDFNLLCSILGHRVVFRASFTKENLMDLGRYYSLFGTVNLCFFQLFLIFSC